MKWIASGVKGVRYREHSERMYRGLPDRYFSIRFTRQGRDLEEGLGWASEGWSVRKASDLRNKLQAAHTTGEGPSSLSEARERTRRAGLQEPESAPLLYRSLVEKHYVPWAKREKKSGWLDETRLRLYIYPAFGDWPLADITPTAVENFREDLLTRRSRSTTMQILALLRKSLNHLASLGLHSLRNPVSDVKMPRLDNACERFLTRDEYDRLLESTLGLGDRDMHDAVILAVNTGLRLGEINRLATQDVDLVHGFLTVRENDGKPGGKVPLNKKVLGMLQQRLEGSTGTLLFPSTDKRGKELSKRFTRLALKLGLNNGSEDRQHRLTFHSLRHTFASWLALADVDLYRIQKLMRHKTFAMVQRYAHLRPSWLRDDVETLCSPPTPPDHDDV